MKKFAVILVLLAGVLVANQNKSSDDCETLDNGCAVDMSKFELFNGFDSGKFTPNLDANSSQNNNLSSVDESIFGEQNASTCKVR